MHVAHRSFVPGECYSQRNAITTASGSGAVNGSYSPPNLDGGQNNPPNLGGSSANAQYANLYVSEMLVYQGVLSEGDRLTVEGYLLEKYFPRPTQGTVVRFR